MYLGRRRMQFWQPYFNFFAGSAKIFSSTAQKIFMELYFSQEKFLLEIVSLDFSKIAVDFK